MYRISISGEATLGADFALANLQVSRVIQFKPGESYGSFTVNIKNDIIPESNETLLIKIFAEDRGTSISGNASVSVTIIDDGKNIVTK